MREVSRTPGKVESTVIGLFGSVGIARGEDIVKVPLASAQKLVAILCQQPDVDRSRSEIGHSLWPEADEGARLNRLRTALVQVRETLPIDAIQADRQTIRLRSASVKVDLWEAKTLVRRANSSGRVVDEEIFLRQLVSIIDCPYLQDFDDEWAELERRNWLHRGIEAKLRLCEIAEQREQWTDGIELVESIHIRSPFEERAWAALLRLNARLGRHTEICSRFAKQQTRLRRELGGRFSPGLVSLADSVRKGIQYPTQLLPPQGDMASRTLSRMISDFPNDALQFLSSDSFRLEVFREPALAADLLGRVIQATSGNSNQRMQAVVFALIANSVLHQHQQIRELAPQVLLHDTDLARRRAAATMLAFAYFHIREWDKAYEYGRTSLDLAKELGEEVGILLSTAQLSAFDWHRGDFETALETYEACLLRLASIDGHNSLTGQAVIAVNIGFIHAYLGHYEEADRWFLRGTNIAAVGNHSAIQTLTLSVHGAVKVMLGGTKTGSEMIGRGLGHAIRQKDARSVEIGLDFCALAVAKLGRFTESQAILAKAHLMRTESQHCRSVAENRLVDTVDLLTESAKPNDEWMRLNSRRQLLNAIQGLLEF